MGGQGFPDFKHVLHPDQVGGYDGFHVGGAAAPQIIAFDARGELAVVRFRLDHVEMTGQQGWNPGLAAGNFANTAGYLPSK